MQGWWGNLALIVALAVGVSEWPPAWAGEVAVDAGEKLFVRNCLVCHQADAIGKPGFGWGRAGCSAASGSGCDSDSGGFLAYVVAGPPR